MFRLCHILALVNYGQYYAHDHGVNDFEDAISIKKKTHRFNFYILTCTFACFTQLCVIFSTFHIYYIKSLNAIVLVFQL